jgi:hypothetical protein
MLEKTTSLSVMELITRLARSITRAAAIPGDGVVVKGIYNRGSALRQRHGHRQPTESGEWR